VAIGQSVVESGLRSGAAWNEICLTIVLGLCLDLSRASALLRRLGLFVLELIGLTLDREQHRPFFDEVTILIIYGLQEARNTCDEIRAVDCSGIARGLQIARDRLLNR